MSTPLFALPPELISLILTFISVIDTINFALMSRTCRAWVIGYLRHQILARTDTLDSTKITHLTRCDNLYRLLVLYEGYYVNSVSGLTQLTMDTHGCHRRMSPVTQRERTEPLVYQNVDDYLLTHIMCGQLNSCLLKIWIHLGYLPRYLSTGKSRCILTLCQKLVLANTPTITVKSDYTDMFNIVARRFVCVVALLGDGTYTLHIGTHQKEYRRVCLWWNDKYFGPQDQPHPLLLVICLFQIIGNRPNTVLPLFKCDVDLKERTPAYRRRFRRKRANLFKTLERGVDEILLGS